MDPSVLTTAAALLGAPGLAYAALLRAVGRALARRWDAASGRAFWRSAALGTALLVACFAALMVLGAYVRNDPPGLGNPHRQGLAYAGYVAAAKTAVPALHAAVVACTWLHGRASARRSGRPHAVAAAAALAVLVFALLTLPLTEFLTACYIGEPVVLGVGC